MNIGIIGCGRISRQHIAALRDNKNVKVVAVCDIIEERAKKAADEIGCAAYTDASEMLVNSITDMVTICTQPSEHYELALMAMTCGNHVLIEKPMTLRIDESKKLIQASAIAGKRVYEVKQNRYNKPIVALRNAINCGSFGKITMITIRLRWCRYNDYFKQDPVPWRGTWYADGGVFASQACHHIDLLRVAGGEVQSVYAKTMRSLLDIEVEDTGFAMVEFKSGAIGIIEATNAARPENLEASISVLGENGSVVVGGTCANKMNYWNLSTMEKPEGCDENPPDIYGFGHKVVYDEIYKNLLDDTGDVVTVHDAFENIKLVNALYESAETGNKVFLHDTFSHSKLGVKNAA